jgi:hypothetical protein
MIDPHSRLVRTGDLVTAPLGDETAMLDLASGSYYILDDIAAVIWASLQTPTTAAQLCAALQQRYDVTPSQCEADVMPFLQALHGQGLVRIVD